MHHFLFILFPVCIHSLHLLHAFNDQFYKRYYLTTWIFKRIYLVLYDIHEMLLNWHGSDKHFHMNLHILLKGKNVQKYECGIFWKVGGE